MFGPKKRALIGQKKNISGTWSGRQRGREKYLTLIRQVFKELFITDFWREVFGLEKRNIFHGPLEFRDGRR
jgi:hypothetical protein